MNERRTMADVHALLRAETERTMADIRRAMALTGKPLAGLQSDKRFRANQWDAVARAREYQERRKASEPRYYWVRMPRDEEASYTWHDEPREPLAAMWCALIMAASAVAGLSIYFAIAGGTP